MGVQVERGYYQILCEVAAAINSTRSPDAILHSIVENVANVQGAKGCSLMLLTPSGKLLLHTAVYGLSDSYIRKGPMSAAKSISEALKGSPIAILDATVDERIQYREQAKREGIVSILSVPMMLRGEIIGVMRIYTEESRYFADEDIYFVKAVAHLGAIALENARLYYLAQKNYEDIRRYVSKWHTARTFARMDDESIAPRKA
ncbi:MAG: GAF domain-containing protein [Dehalococcoidia bacterium]|nr:MAG: GAF domain-containing protein [Dehalococcoidia bacterium]